ncbi:MAG: alpha-amylase family glycosyl hydrolase, partial [Planctomycetota bacterium]|nr:alpha-amylase family glycosyl hydrolase [Planctomycetota bacterium]
MADPREGAGVFTSLSPLPTEGGTLFRVVSNAEALHLLLYGKEREKPTVIALDETHRRDDVWEILVPGVGSGQRYNWAVDPARPLVDPYALEVDGPDTFGADTKGPRPVWPDLNVAHRFAGVVRAPLPRVEWRRPARSWDETVLYELHVRGFTRHASSRVKEPGGFRGLIEKVGYLQRLGVTAVELLPVQEFDDQEVHRGRGLVNYWGYSPLNWFAPNARYGSIEDFRGLVRAFHDAGIEVIVDVVFNHTAEMDPTGPVWNFRDLDNDRYYLEEDVTGCGNTVKAQHPTVRKLILEALRWWRHGLGVDGFRFDLAAVLARGETGEVLDAPALLREIETDPWLSGARLIAEAWDAGGAYLVTDWPGNERWAVWNDRFRDDVRRAWLNGGDNGIGHRLAGSPDLFPDPRRSINFITA